MSLTIEELHNKLKSKELRPIDLVNDCLEEIENNKELNAFITIDKEGAIMQALKLEDKEVDNLFFGIPIAIKDNIVSKDMRTSCASKILENFVSQYDATVIEKIKAKNMIIIGKTNMDEFGMGSSGANSYFGQSKNPYDKTKVAGGSSGGSAIAVATKQALMALGSDTGGSIRQPSTFCKIVGMKPTYGRVSRYGLVAFASSLDQIGPMTKSVRENALLLELIAGRDERDLTSSSKESEDFSRYIGQDIKGLKIAVPNYFMSDIVKPEIRLRIKETIDFLKASGAVVDYVDIKHIEYTVTLYKIIAMAEASSNLARFDGLRYGFSSDNFTTVDELYENTRAEGFGDDVKQRIMLGSYLLSGNNAEKYFDKAMTVRAELTDSFKELFSEYDLIIGPSTSDYPNSINAGENELNKLSRDVLVNHANMTGMPAMTVPLNDDKPTGLHITGNYFDEARMYQLAAFIEKAGVNNDL